MTIRFYVARHGNTFEADEPPRRIGRRSDMPLTEVGLAQADRLGAHLAAEARIEAILCGPLRRTQETARRVGHLLDLEVRGAVDWLDEIDHGVDESQREADVATRIGEEALRAWNHEGILPEGWIGDETLRLGAWRHFIATLRRTTLLVTSNGAARFLFRALPDLCRPESLALATGAYGWCDIDDGQVVALQWNIRPV